MFAAYNIRQQYHCLNWLLCAIMQLEQDIAWQNVCCALFHWQQHRLFNCPMNFYAVQNNEAFLSYMPMSAATGTGLSSQHICQIDTFIEHSRHMHMHSGQISSIFNGVGTTGWSHFVAFRTIFVHKKPLKVGHCMVQLKLLKKSRRSSIL